MVVRQANNQTEVKPLKNTSTMKTKNILMSVLLAMGFIAVKAAGYPPELALVSQPVLVYNYNSITVYYDVQNIGDYTYRGDICLFLSPDNGYCYAEKYVKVRPGRIKRVAIEIPAYRPNPARAYTIMPYYEVGDELYSFTTFEYFEPLAFYWNGPRTERWVVINMPPRVRYYTRPGIYRYYYDGFRPPMPPPHIAGHGPATPPPPMNPMHHTYNYHHSNGGYPATNHWNDNPPAPNNESNNGGSNNIQATVRPNNSAGSMSSSTTINGDNNTPTPSNATTGSMSRPNSSNRPNGASTGSATHHNNNSSGNVNRPSSNGRNNSGNVNRPSGNNNNNSGNVNRPSGNNNRNGSSSRPSNSNSSNTRTNSSNSGRSSGSTTSGRSR